MHIHKLEKLWIGFGIGMLVVFLLVLGVGTFAMGLEPPHSDGHSSLDPTKVAEHPPFHKPGLKELGDNRFEAIMTAFAFGYGPNVIKIPSGATVDFIITSTDVVHGFQIVGTNVNAMVVPGEVTKVRHTFDEAGEYLILCNEYCGTYHEVMQARVIVS